MARAAGVQKVNKASERAKWSVGGGVWEGKLRQGRYMHKAVGCGTAVRTGKKYEGYTAKAARSGRPGQG